MLCEAWAEIRLRDKGRSICWFGKYPLYLVLRATFLSQFIEVLEQN
jgi:hypothetical protein